MTRAATPYGFVDALSPALFKRVMSSLHGSVADRGAALVLWRTRLLTGALPTRDELAWPDAHTRDALLDVFAEFDMASFCKNDPELTEFVLLDMLDQLDSAERLRERIALTFAQLDTLAAKRAGGACDGAGAPSVPIGAHRGNEDPLPKAMGWVDDATRSAVARESLRLATDLMASKVRAGLRAQWEHRVEAWRELRALAALLGQVLPRGWTHAQGLLRPAAWMEFSRLRKTMESLPALRALVETLGRLRADAQSRETVAERIVGTILREVTRDEEVVTPLAKVEVMGLERSGEVSRVLPSEMAMLAHPTLRMLWHARRAEASLLAYHAQGVYTQRVQATETFSEELGVERPRAARGPVLVCLDTSGSMMGLPETVAKAVVLYAAATCWRDERPCLLYTFSGPGQTVEHDLSHGDDGLERLLIFLMMSFGGGTDLEAPLQRVLDRLDEARWRHADLLLVTDGQFALPAYTVSAMLDARARYAMKVHGLMVGADPAELSKICTEVHAFATWASMMQAVD